MKINRQHITDRLHDTEARWFALRTSNRHEKVATQLLERSGIKCFLPLQKKQKHYKRKTVTRECCLLPGYVFVSITRAELPHIFTNPYVKFLKIGELRLDIPPREIEILRRIIGDKELNLEWELCPQTDWQEGQEVELIGGHLTGTRGIYMKTHNKGYLVISLGLLPVGMGLQTTVPENQVRPVNRLTLAKKEH